MVTDYTKRPAKNSPHLIVRKCIAWALIIIAILLPASLFVSRYLAVKKIKKNVAVASQATTQQQPQFDFYRILPQQQVEVTSQPMNADIDNSRGTTPHDNTVYILQVAALRDQADANLIKDKLTSAGYHSFVQTYNKNNSLWFRVLVGPYVSRDNAEQDQRNLHRAHYDSLLLATKPSQH